MGHITAIKDVSIRYPALARDRTDSLACRRLGVNYEAIWTKLIEAAEAKAVPKMILEATAQLSTAFALIKRPIPRKKPLNGFIRRHLYQWV